MIVIQINLHLCIILISALCLAVLAELGRRCKNISVSILYDVTQVINMQCSVYVMTGYVH
jgi:hypothetical protein